MTGCGNGRPPVRACGTHVGMEMGPPRTCSSSVESTLHTPCTTPACGGRCARVRQPAAGGGVVVEKCSGQWKMHAAASLRAPSPSFHVGVMDRVNGYTAVHQRSMAIHHGVGACSGAWRPVDGCRNGRLFLRGILSVSVWCCVALLRPRSRARSRQPRCQQM